MGYNTLFRGAFHFNKQPSQELIKKVNDFSEERHDDIFTFAPWCHWVIVKDSKWRFKNIRTYDLCCCGFTEDDSKYTSYDGDTINITNEEKYENEDYQENEWVLKWNGTEKFYNYVEYLEYLIENFFEPEGIRLIGTVEYCGQMGLINEENIYRDNGLNEIDNYRFDEAKEMVEGLKDIHKEGLDTFIIDMVLDSTYILEGKTILSGKLEEDFIRMFGDIYGPDDSDSLSDSDNIDIKKSFKSNEEFSEALADCYEKFLMNRFNLSTLNWDDMEECERNQLRIGFVRDYIDIEYDLNLNNDYWEWECDCIDNDSCKYPDEDGCPIECMKEKGYIDCYQDFFKPEWCKTDFGRSIISDLEIFNTVYSLETQKRDEVIEWFEGLKDDVKNGDIVNKDNSPLSKKQMKDAIADFDGSIQEVKTLFNMNIWRFRDCYKGDSGFINCKEVVCDEYDCRIEECQECQECQECKESDDGCYMYTKVNVVGVAGKFEH